MHAMTLNVQGYFQMQHLRDQDGNQVTYLERYLIASYCSMRFRGVAGITRRPALLSRSPLNFIPTYIH